MLPDFRFIPQKIEKMGKGPKYPDLARDFEENYEELGLKWKLGS